MKKIKVLLFDVEVAPNIITAWKVWEANAVWEIQDWYMMSFAYKWLGENKTYVKKLPDYNTFKKDKADDCELIEDLWRLFNEADIIVGHNLDSFDIKKANTRFILNDLDAPSDYRTVDTLKIAKKYFKFTRNNLDALGEYLGVGRKVETGGYKLWKNCMDGDKKAWATMAKYNKQDVDLLERVYKRLAPYHKTHPNMAAIAEVPGCCPLCVSDNIINNGFSYTNAGKKNRYRCNACGRTFFGKTTEITTNVK